jgi:hypothetical protein
MKDVVAVKRCEQVNLLGRVRLDSQVARVLSSSGGSALASLVQRRRAKVLSVLSAGRPQRNRGAQVAKSERNARV